MRLGHSVKPAGLLISGLLALGLLSPTEAAAASDCPCFNVGGGVCVPDPACEARERQLRDRWMRDRWMRQRETRVDPGNVDPGNNATMARPPTTIVPLPRSGHTMEYHAPEPPTLAPAPRSGTTMDYRAPPPATLAPAPRNGTTTDHRAPPPTTSAPRPPNASSAATHAPPSTPPPTASTPTAGSGNRVSSGGRLRILETGYSHLSELGREERGYGLYSYAILPSGSKRAETFLTELFKEVPSIGQTAARRSQLNIFYVPLRKDREPDFAALLQTSGTNAEKIGAEYSRSLYDYRMARALLDHVCNPPAESVRVLCDGDLSRGPYIFTYASPASHMNSVPPPFLFVDLSNVHEQAFGEFIDAFKSQVKSDDITDQARIQTLRLTILNVALTAADWVNPVEKAIADIVHSPSGDDKK
jgi:hypothetical protein